MVKATVRVNSFSGTKKAISGKAISGKAIPGKAISGKAVSGKGFSGYGPFVPQRSPCTPKPCFVFGGSFFRESRFRVQRLSLYLFGVHGTGISFSGYRDYRVFLSGLFIFAGFGVQGTEH